MIRIFMIGYSNERGGVERYISSLKSVLDPSEYEFVYAWPEMLLDGKKWVAPRNRHHYLKYRLFWRQFFKENKFDVVYENVCDIVSIDDLRFAKHAGVPVRIIHSHSSGVQQNVGSDISLFHKFLAYRNKRVLHRFATSVFACSDAAGKWMYGDQPYTVIKNGINLSEYAFDGVNREMIRKNNSIADDSIAIGCIGRFTNVKNLFFAIDVFDTLLKKKKATLVLIGDGEQKNELLAYVNAKQLSDSVVLTGVVDNVNQWMSALDCILMPSIFEGLPFVLVEAQAAGLPCVVSSNVSQEANITGLVEYVGLDESLDLWADKIISVAEKQRPDTTSILTKAGYSNKATALQVSDIIKRTLSEGAK